MQFIDPHQDHWHKLIGEDGPPTCITPVPHLLLDLGQWHAFRAHWPQGMPVGVVLPNDVDVETLVPDLPQLSLVALQFPKWTDGRAYSQAHLLRSRFRFRGEVRATGEVVVDMLPLLQRAGVDAVVLRADQSVDVARRALNYFPEFYQGDVHEHNPHFAKVAA